MPNSTNDVYDSVVLPRSAGIWGGDSFLRQQFGDPTSRCGFQESKDAFDHLPLLIGAWHPYNMLAARAIALSLGKLANQRTIVLNQKATETVPRLSSRRKTGICQRYLGIEDVAGQVCAGPCERCRNQKPQQPDGRRLWVPLWREAEHPFHEHNRDAGFAQGDFEPDRVERIVRPRIRSRRGISTCETFLSRSASASSTLSPGLCSRFPHTLKSRNVSPWWYSPSRIMAAIFSAEPSNDNFRFFDTPIAQFMYWAGVISCLPPESRSVEERGRVWGVPY